MNDISTQQDTETSAKKTFSLWRFLRRLVMWLTGLTLFLVALCVTLVYIYEDEVKGIIIAELNKHLQAEVRVEPSNIDLTIIKTFPDCALRFKKVTMMEATRARDKDTLLYADNILLSFNLSDLFHKRYAIRQVLVSKASIHLEVDESGRPNYIAWKTDSTAKGDGVKFALEKISLKDAELQYTNRKTKLRIRAHVKQVDFKGLFDHADYAMSAHGQAFVSLLQVQKTKYVKDKRLTFAVDVDVKGSDYHFRQADLGLNQMLLSASGHMRYKDSLQDLSIDYAGKNMEISSVLSLLPEKFQQHISDYTSDGLFYAKGSCRYQAGSPLAVESDFGIRQATITYKPQSAKLTGVNLVGKFVVKDKVSRLLLQHISASLGNNSFKGNCEVVNFNDPYLALDAEVNTSLQDLLKFYPIDTIQSLSGDLVLNTSIEGLVRSMKHPAASGDIKATGVATVRNLQLQFKHADKMLNIPGGEVKLNGTDLQVNHLQIIHGRSDLSLIGSMPAFLNYVFDSKAALTIDAQLSSDKLSLEDFMGGGTGGKSSTVSIPPNLNFNLDATISHFSFSKFTADEIRGRVYVKDQKVFVKNVSLKAMDGTATLNAFADASGDNIKLSAESDLSGINIRRLFTELNNFGQTTLQDKHLKGFATASIDFSATCNRQLDIDPGSVNATSSLVIEHGELVGFKPLESLAKYIDLKELQHITFSTLQSAVEIKNKTITIPKTSVRSSAINIEFYGKHTFGNIIDYHLQLLLSELLAKRHRANRQLDDELALVENDPENKRSVFIVMTGPADNPTIRYDKKGAKEKIKQDIRQEKQNLKQLLREEFGFFKKDSLAKKPANQPAQQFKIDNGSNNKKLVPSLQPKKKEDDDF